jgi:hypothetical protein
MPAWPTDAREAIGAQLDKLRKSEPLHASEELTVRKAQPGDSDQGTGLLLRIPTEGPADERLVVADSQAANRSRYNMSEQDVDGDGELELILPDGSGGLCVVKPTTGEIKQVRLHGLQQTHLQTVRGVNIDGEMCWLCAGTRYGMVSQGLPQQRSLVRLYSPEGEILWTFSPPLPEKAGAMACAAAGDLDGDGTVEYAIGLTTYVLEPRGENSSGVASDMQGRLFVLDQGGRLIAQRELDGPVELVYVAAAQPGQPAPLLCLSNGQLERYVVRPAAVSPK